MIRFKVEKVGNMVFVSDEGNHVWKAWDEAEFTERKLTNAKKKIQSGFKNEIEFVRFF